MFVFALVFAFVFVLALTRHRGLGHEWCLVVGWLTWKTGSGCTPDVEPFKVGLADGKLPSDFCTN